MTLASMPYTREADLVVPPAPEPRRIVVTVAENGTSRLARRASR